MVSSRVIKKDFFMFPHKAIKQLSIFFLVIVFIAAVSYKIFYKTNVAAETGTLAHKSDQTLFLENLMIRNAGLFTLYGSKPVTEFDIEGTIDETEEELQRSYKELKVFLESSSDPAKMELPTYDNFREKWIKNQALLRPHNHLNLWKEWKNYAVLLDPKYRIFSRKAPSGNGSIGLFVNIPNLVYILHHHHSEFSKRTNTDFSPAEVIREIEDENSNFWSMVFQDHYLSGLIYGYGEKSSYLFDWSKKHLSTVQEERKTFFATYPKSKPIQPMIEISALPLPTYFHFGVTDPAHMIYEHERKQILEYLSDKEFVPTLLNDLSKKQ